MSTESMLKAVTSAVADDTGTQKMSSDEVDAEYKRLEKRYGYDAYQYGLNQFRPRDFSSARVLLDSLEGIMRDYRIQAGQARRERQKIEIAIKSSPLVFWTLCNMHGAYGGHEEGGWYYTAYEPIAHIAVDSLISPERLEKLKFKLVADNANKLDSPNKYRGHGVGGCGDDDGLCIGSFDGNEGWGWQYSEGVPYEWEGRPHYE